MPGYYHQLFLFVPSLSNLDFRVKSAAFMQEHKANGSCCLGCSELIKLQWGLCCPWPPAWWDPIMNLPPACHTQLCPGSLKWIEAELWLGSLDKVLNAGASWAFRGLHCFVSTAWMHLCVFAFFQGIFSVFLGTPLVLVLLISFHTL